jgi:hypothetical protein
VVISSVAFGSKEPGGIVNGGSFSSWYSREDSAFASVSYSALCNYSASPHWVSIWLADVSEISIEHRIAYIEVASEYLPRRDAHVCQLVLKDGRIIPFYSSREMYIKRLAAGFSYLTHKPISGVSQFPPVGCVCVPVSDQSIGGSLIGGDIIPMVVEEQIDGPFDSAGIPVGAVVKEIDGSKGNDQQLISGLKLLGAGSHKIRWYFSGDWTSTLTTINVESEDGEAPELNTPPQPSK